MTNERRLTPPRFQFWIRSVAIAALVSTTSFVGIARAVDATFVVDPARSELTIAASTVLVIPFSDSDTQSLGGSINAIFDFGQSGSFPASAELSIDDAEISPLAPFSLTLGAPPLGVDVTIEDAVARITTPAADLTLTGAAGIVYEFDANQFTVTLDEGTVKVTGAVTETIDLAAEPASGTAPPGTIGMLTLTPGTAIGPYLPVDGLMELPMTFTQIIDVDGQQVTLDVDGQVVAESSFFVALSPIPGDLDGDLDVDGDDRAIWEQHFGVDGSGDVDGDNNTDGRDFVLWQRSHGLAPPTPPVATVVPEPAVVWLALAGNLCWALRRR